MFTQTFKLWDIITVDHPEFHRGPYTGYVVFYDDQDDTYLLYLPFMMEGHSGRGNLTPQEAHNILDLLPQGTNDFFWSSPRFMRSTDISGNKSILDSYGEVVMTRNTPEGWWFGPHSEFVEGDIDRKHIRTTEDGENRYRIQLSNGDYGLGVSPTMFVPKVLVANMPTPQQPQEEVYPDIKPGDIVRCVSDETIDITVGKVYLVNEVARGQIHFYDDAGDRRNRPARRYEKVYDAPREEPGPLLGDYFPAAFVDTPSDSFTVTAEETTVNTFSFSEFANLYAVVDDENELVAITAGNEVARELVNATMLNQETYRVVKIKR